MKEVLDTVRRSGPISKQELLSVSKMTSSTLTRLLEDALSLRILAEVGLGESTGGRRPILYKVNPQYAYAFGLDISRTRCKLVLVDLAHQVLDAKDWPMTNAVTPDSLLRLAADAADSMLLKHELRKEAVLGMGVGAVGPLDRIAGVIQEPLYFPGTGWHQVEVRRMLEEMLGIPVWLDNGANTAMMAEYWRDKDNPGSLLYVMVGIGLRSAMMTNGRLVYGAVDMEGALGQMIIQADGVAHRMPGGNYGALESYVSIYALEKTARALAKKEIPGIPPDWLRRPEGITLADINLANANGYPAVTAMLEEAASYLGIGLANMLNVLHPDKVYLGGTLVAAFPTFFEKAVAVARSRTMYHSRYPVVFSMGHLGESAAAIGAAIMVINQLVE
jgi:predicted NBD/HSP70 family sugar kinase